MYFKRNLLVLDRYADWMRRPHGATLEVGLMPQPGQSNTRIINIEDCLAVNNK
jgi:hypothetical protein